MTSDQDLRYLQASVESLEEYLLSDEIFWQLGGGDLREGPSTRLSLGVLDLSLARLSAASFSGADRERYEQLNAEVVTLKNRWRAAWARKAAREFRSRLHLWQNYLNDALQGQDSERGLYRQEVRMRVMLEYLRMDAEQLPIEEETLLDGLDRRLHANFDPGEFQWDSSLAAAFPKQKFWYLYGQIRQK